MNLSLFLTLSYSFSLFCFCFSTVNPLDSNSSKILSARFYFQNDLIKSFLSKEFHLKCHEFYFLLFSRVHKAQFENNYFSRRQRISDVRNRPGIRRFVRFVLSSLSLFFFYRVLVYFLLLWLLLLREMKTFRIRALRRSIANFYKSAQRAINRLMARISIDVWTTINDIFLNRRMYPVSTPLNSMYTHLQVCARLKRFHDCSRSLFFH